MEQNPSATGSGDVWKTSVPSSTAEPRVYYLKHWQSLKPPQIAYSHFIPQQTVEFLMRYKKDAAIGSKFSSNTSRLNRITNLEGALHTFVTPVVEATIHGDYRWGPGHGVLEFKSEHGLRFGRTVLVSALIQQDFEFDNVMLQVARLDKQETIGRIALPRPLTTEEKQNDARRQKYDGEIRQFLVHHLTSQHKLPAINADIKEEALSVNHALQFFIHAIEKVESQDIPSLMQRTFMHHRGHFISLEIIFWTAFHQIRNEMLLLEQLCYKQGYVYTFNPPAIFVQFFGSQGTMLLSLVHATALKYFTSMTRLQHCKVFAWADFSSSIILGLIRTALKSHPEVVVMKHDELFSAKLHGKPGHGLYYPPAAARDALLVIHNNSDAFGQNIETEPSGGSLDGVVGTWSSTAGSLMRHREDLCSCLFEIPPSEGSGNPLHNSGRHAEPQSPYPVIPHIHLLTMQSDAAPAFTRFLQVHGLANKPQLSVTHHRDISLKYLDPALRFDLIVSPANSHGLLDGAFDDAISRAFSPQDDYYALTRAVQGQLFTYSRGYTPPGSCVIVRIPSEFAASKQLRYGDGSGWGCKFLALCPTMRVPTDVRWDREVVYECIWSLLSALERHNKDAAEQGRDGDVVRSILMTPLATGIGRVSVERWAEQCVLAIKHWLEAGEQPDRWGAMVLQFSGRRNEEIEQTWKS